jgi:hypothetical protein
MPVNKEPYSGERAGHLTALADTLAVLLSTGLIGNRCVCKRSQSAGS